MPAQRKSAKSCNGSQNSPVWRRLSPARGRGTRSIQRAMHQLRSRDRQPEAESCDENGGIESQKGMSTFDLKDHPHRRWNPLTREWVLDSPHRAERPWQGQMKASTSEPAAKSDPACYHCPENARAGERKISNSQGHFFSTTITPPCGPIRPPGKFATEISWSRRQKRNVPRGLFFAQART